MENGGHEIYNLTFRTFSLSSPLCVRTAVASCPLESLQRTCSKGGAVSFIAETYLVHARTIRF